MHVLSSYGTIYCLQWEKNKSETRRKLDEMLKNDIEAIDN